jgi:hypothetical protein
MPTSRRCVNLVEDEVFTVLGGAGSSDPNWWIFDTGASNHMTSIREVFSDLKIGVISMVRLGDGFLI